MTGNIIPWFLIGIIITILNAVVHRKYVRLLVKHRMLLRLFFETVLSIALWPCVIWIFFRLLLKKAFIDRI